MKKLSILLAIIGLLASCKGETHYFDVEYLDGTHEKLQIHANNTMCRPQLMAGCIYWYNSDQSIVCGVKRYKHYTIRDK